ncbi:MAG: hypothetical protein JWN14_4196 [Chthonomonadales bacterium]|nr:hypothetical protein [Chthonomonadales bacterium]
MEQQTLPLEEHHAPSDISHSFGLETDQSQDPSLHTETPTAQTDGVEIIGAALSERIAKNQKREGRAIWSIPLFYSLMGMVLLIGKTLLGDERAMAWITSPFAYVPGLVFWLGMTLFLTGSILEPRKRLRKMAQTLVDTNDVRAVGALIDTLKLEDRKIRSIAVEGLIKLLPRLQAKDAELLNPEQRALLCSRLSRPPKKIDVNLRPLSPAAYQREVAFRVAILQAFAQVGDSRALAVVERLVQGEAKTEELRQVQAAAQACLPSLILRCEQIRSHKTLLRAADASDTGAETLLRAAQGTRETPPEQLLRPDSSPKL